ncbi:MAG: hypothetical protein RPU72_17645, partial [Candidatus Sedimenticola sp. (ex Thyasira tokunagai)]
MSIDTKIHVNTHYTRSINLERDADSVSVVEAYIPTSRAVRTLSSMLLAFKADESPRAWSLVGPYGSGKSAFAIYLSHLLANPNIPATKAAFRKLNSVDASMGRCYKTLTKNSEGYCTILLTGSPESLSRRIVHALAHKAEEIWSHKRGRTPDIVNQLSELAKQKELPTTNEVVDCVIGLQNKLS